jgi:hypothetical protein
METIFDRLTAVPEQPVERGEEVTGDTTAPAENEAHTGQYTSREIKVATQELLKYGLLEADKKPNLYRTALVRREAINRILEPLDLRLDIDDVRGLAFLVVAEPLFDDEGDEWSHPLIRRQRLTLEQSLLVAILRQHYVVHEQEAGVGAGAAVVAVDELLPQLQVYLGETGSDLRDDKRLRTLLEALKNHGIVSDIDERDQITIRPIITHLANPESLQNLLQHLRNQAAGAAIADNTATGDEEVPA